MYVLDFSEKTVNLADSYMMGGDPAMNIIIAQVPVLNMPEYVAQNYPKTFASN